MGQYRRPPTPDRKKPVSRRPVSIPLTAPQAVASSRGLLWEPEHDRGGAAVVLAHGAGSTMEHPVGLAVAEGLAAAGVPVLAFNFAYVEAGRRRPDPTPRLLSAWRDVLCVADGVFAGRPLVLGGRSMGGRMASMLVTDGVPAAGLLLLAYPLHPVGRPDRLRVDHWDDILCPVLFVSGSRDQMMDFDVLAEHRRRLAASEVHVVEGADHGFAVRKADGRSRHEVVTEVVRTADGWLARLPVDARP